MGLFDRIKNAFSNPKPGNPSSTSSDDPCEDQTFAPRFKEKKINVFVSSTFRDMVAERDELTLKIFPALRKECELRGIAWSEVDLRWGIPSKKSKLGEAVGICLRCIDECRPYFIGMLGERYGWVDPDAPEKVKGDFPWVQEQADRSITELEILHGVLNNPKMEDHAFFYFRDMAYLESEEFKAHVPEADRAGFFESEDIPQQKLADLKDRIRRSGFPVQEDYPNPGAFGEMVKSDLLAIIESIAPSSQEISEEDKVEVYLDRDLAAHETFVASRFGVYIRRKEYFDRLDAHASGDGEPLVIVGESGSGKSALLAHWAFAYRANHTKELVLFHFVGATSSSTDWARMLRRIMGELKRECRIRMEVPTKEEELRPAFANFLSMAGKKRKVVLIIDALNQLEDQGGALDLTWLPPKIPDGVRLIVSTLPGKSLETARKRNFSTLEIHPLTNEEQSRLIVCYFKKFHKEPSSEMISKLVRSEQCRNPLYLCAVLEEIRIHGVYEQLVGQITDLLSAKTIPALYEKILARYERDYEQDRPGLVRDLCRLVWASRRGLTRDELRGLLGAGDQPLPDAYWAPLLLAMQHGLVEKGDVLTFFHDYLREAVQTRYLPNEAVVTASHLALADFFEKQPATGPRRVEELPWQLAAAGAWDRLVGLLIEPTFFSAVYEAREYDLKHYWVQIEAGSPFRVVKAYAKAIEDREYDDNGRNMIASLLYQMGYPAEAGLVWERMTASATDPNVRQALLGNQAVILKARGDLDGAMALHKEEERICRELRNVDGLQQSLGNQANILADRGDLDGAMALHKEEERLCRDLGNVDGLSRSLGNQALILYDRGDLDGAMALLKESERLCRDLGNVDYLSASLGNQANILYSRGDLDGAMALYKEKERICRDLGNVDGLSNSLGNQALILYDRGDLDGAMALMKEQERLCRDLGNVASLQQSLGGQALILKARGDLDGSMALMKEQERLCRDLGNVDYLSASLGNQANILYSRGDLDGAMALHKEQERICRELGNVDGLQGSLGNQALILQIRGDLDGAMALHKEKERICRDLGNVASLQQSLGGQALILKARGDLDGAMELYKEQERICRKLGNVNSLSYSLGNQALILKARGDLNGSLVLLKESEQICRDLGNVDSLQKLLGNQALILQDRGDLDGAMALHKEEERLCRDLGNIAGLSISLENQASILYARGDLDGAMALYKESERISRDLGNVAGLQISLGNQALILKARGDLDGSLALLKEEERLCRDLGNVDDLRISLGQQALILKALGDLDGSLVLYKEQERICRNLGNIDSLQTSLRNQATILYDRSDLDGALALLRESELICRDLGNVDDLQASLGNQAVILQTRGDLDGAMALYKEKERICRDLGNVDDLQAALGNQAVILQTRGDLDDAMALHKDKELLCRDLGNVKGLAYSLANQALILAQQGRRMEASRAIDEALSLLTKGGYTSMAATIRERKEELGL